MMNILFVSVLKRSYPGKKLNLIFAGEAENGQQVIDHLEKEPVDLLLLDIKMRAYSKSL